MSARTPFIPSGSRPASRAVHAKDQPAAKPAHFIPDSTNPLHAEKHASKTGPTNASGDSSFVHQPLNTNNIFKRKNASTNVSTNFSRRPSTSENAAGISVAHPPLNQQQELLNRTPRRDLSNNSHIHAPKPLTAANSASPLFSDNNTSARSNSLAFKTPFLPAASKDHDLENVSPVKTHSNSAHISPLRGHDDMDPALLAGPPVAFKLNMSLSNQTAPQRVLLHQNSPISDHGATKTWNKRARSEFDDDERDMSVPAKRFKAHPEDEAHSRNMEYDRRPTFSPQMSSPIAPSHHSDYHQQSPVRTNSRSQSHRRHQEFPAPQHDSRNDMNQSLSGQGALDKLLGRDADLFVDEHMERYHLLAAKWRDCTMEEWVAGADDVMSKYHKILDFVKAHMTTKLKLFTTFDTQVDAHNKVLDERQNILAGVKQRLVSESGNILGKGKLL